MEQIQGFADVHAHFVYGVDDGAGSEARMCAMLDAAYADGVRVLFGTSHQTPGLEAFPQELYDAHLERARAYCRMQGYEMQLFAGAELLYNPMLKNAARESGLATLGESRWVLMEFLPDVSAKELEKGLREASDCGYLVLMAHVERYRCLEQRGLLEKLRKQYPVLCQMNASTVLDPGGFWHRWRIERWLKNGVIDMIASDAHNTTSRSTKMRAAYEKLARMLGADAADRMTGRSGAWMQEIME